MDERDRPPAQPSQAGDLGAMTGATGSLTPADPDDAFVPAETRELTDPEAARDLTAATYRRRELRRSEPDEPGSLLAHGENTAPNARDGGYGSEHGLAGDDPVYREETHLPEAPPAVAPSDPSGLGQDEARDPGDEHF